MAGSGASKCRQTNRCSGQLTRRPPLLPEVDCSACFPESALAAATARLAEEIQAKGLVEGLPVPGGKALQIPGTSMASPAACV